MEHTQASQLSSRRVAKLLDTDIQLGLSSAEVRLRQENFGPNKLYHCNSDPNLNGNFIRNCRPLGRFILNPLVRFTCKLVHPLTLLLVMLAVLYLLLGEYANAGVVLLAVVLVTLISCYQQYRIDHCVKNLDQQIKHTCSCLRGGKLYQIAAEDLVPGDIVQLNEGQKVPADLRLFDTRSLVVNESSLTGKTRAQLKLSKPIASQLGALKSKAMTRSEKYAEFEEQWTEEDEDEEAEAEETDEQADETQQDESKDEASNSSRASERPGEYDSIDSNYHSYQQKSQERKDPMMVTADDFAHNYIYDHANDELNSTNTTSNNNNNLYSVPRLISNGSQEPNNSDEFFSYRNIALMGTIIESGTARGIVICTGKSTRFGQVYLMLKGSKQPKCSLQVRVDQWSMDLAIASFILIALVAIGGILQNRKPIEIMDYSMALAVVSIPEGLPVLFTLIIAISINRLSRKGTVVRSLENIETLGKIEILCADKTGTLTRKDMQLTDIITSELYSISSHELDELKTSEKMSPMTFNKFGSKMYSIGRLIEVGTLCNNATVEEMCDSFGEDQSDSGVYNSEQEQPKQPQTMTFQEDPYNGDNNNNSNQGSDSAQPSAYRLIGQATECAILDAAIRLGFGDSRKKYDRLDEIPFNSKIRKMIVRCKRRDQNSTCPMYYVKGAWEVVLEDCSHYYECGLIKPKTEELWQEYERICCTLGSQGLRVLAMACGPVLGQLTFVGIIGITNTVRDDVKETLLKMRQKFHIDVKMITGDSKSTAASIGRQLGLIQASNSATYVSYSFVNGLQDAYMMEIEKDLMSGEQLKQLLQTDKDQLLKAQEIASKTIFYRVDPVQKANIISKLQDLNKNVAMIGDGINDLISLKRADLSICIGSGSNICKEICDIILLNSRISVLFEAIREGKAIRKKLRTFLFHQIAVSLSLMIVLAYSYGFNLESPLIGVLQTLCLNLIADGPLLVVFLAVLLAS